MKKIKIRKEMKDRLRDLYEKGHGVSRKEIKDEKNWSPLIHSHNTYKTYLQHVDKFADWCMNRGVRYSNEVDMKDYVALYLMDEYIDKEKSAWTCSTVLQALCKALGFRSTDVPVELPKRERSRIKRSREVVERDRHINFEREDVKTTMAFCRAFGFRNNKELKRLEKSDFYEKDGKLWCHIESGKGGKSREIEMYATKEEETMIRHYLSQQDNALMLYVPSGLDVHSLRGQYVGRVYNTTAREKLADVPPKERYVCRKDKAGDIYDKKALKNATGMVGHNRLCVIPDNYGKYLKTLK